MTLGRSDAALCIAVFKWIDGAVPGLPSRDWAWWSGLFVSLLQLGIAAIPWGLHSNWGIFLATAIEILLAYLSASLPQWRQEKWSAATREKDVAVTIGNGNKHVIVILGAQHGLDMEDLATGKAPDLLSTRIYTSLLAVFWLVLLITCCGIKRDSWYLLAVGGLSMAQNLIVASVPRTPAALGLPIELVSSGNEDQIVPEIFAEPKVMWTIMEFEEKHRGRGNALVKEFFPGKLLDWEEKWGILIIRMRDESSLKERDAKHGEKHMRQHKWRGRRGTSSSRNSRIRARRHLHKICLKDEFSLRKIHLKRELNINIPLSRQTILVSFLRVEMLATKLCKCAGSTARYKCTGSHTSGISIFFHNCDPIRYGPVEIKKKRKC